MKIMRIRTALLLTAGMMGTSLLPRLGSAQVLQNVVTGARLTVADLDVVCKYKNETYTLHGKILRHTKMADTILINALAINDLSYLFPTGTCAELMAYFDPYSVQPPQDKDGLARLRTLPSEPIDGVVCRVVELLDPEPPPAPANQTLPLTTRVKLRWYISPNGQTVRMRGEFQLVKADALTVDPNLLVMDATFRFREPHGSVARAASGNPLRTLKALLEGTSVVSEIACSPTEPRVAVAGSDGAIGVWDTTTLKQVYNLTGNPGSEPTLAFSGNGKRLAAGMSGQNGVVSIWDMQTGRQIRAIATGLQSLTSVSLSPDGKLLAAHGVSLSSGESVQVWKVETGKSVAVLADKRATQVVFSPDGKMLATGSPETIHLWDVTTWKQRLTLPSNGEPWGFVGRMPLVFSLDSKLLAAGDTHQAFQQSGLVMPDSTDSDLPSATIVRVWDTHTGHLHLLQGTTGPVNALAFAPNGKMLAVVDRDRGAEGQGSNSAVLLWNTQTWQQIGTVGVEHGKSIQGVGWTADSAVLLTTYNDAVIKFWPVPTSK